MNIEEHATDRQKAAVKKALGYVREDGDRAGEPEIKSDFNVHIVQYDNSPTNKDEIVRTWIAMPNGKLTWRS